MSIAAIDLFCGIGGLSKGLSLAGIELRAGFDNDNSCKFAYEKNNAEFVCADNSNLKGSEIIKRFKKDDIKILAGCAPCQPFSRYSLKYRKNGWQDEKWKLLYSFARLVDEVNPDIVVMENVPNLEKQNVYKDFIGTLKTTGFATPYSRIVYCPDYGVPQKRKRLILIASKFGKIDLIDPLYTPENYRTVRDAIGTLEKISAGQSSLRDPLHTARALSEKNIKRIEQSVPGGTWRDWDENLKLKCHRRDTGHSYPSVYGRMEWDKPSPTITTQFYGYGNGRFGHPEQNRAISFREGALLQSFPREYVFIDEKHPINTRELGIHIGNAVPVEIGRAIGISIMNHLSNQGRIKND